MKKIVILVLSVLIFSSNLCAQPLGDSFEKFSQIYQQQLTSTQACDVAKNNVFRVCSAALRNDGNAPYILHHAQATEKVVVLFHGLSDSPFYLKSIANAIYAQGYNVVVALVPGHGKKDADQDMQDPKLAQRWYAHVDEIMDLANDFGEQIYIGGFSTGGALASRYVLLNPGKTQGLLLFSGALALDSTVETMAKIWGIKWFAKTVDGDYQALGPNPFKYPSVARYSAFQLTDVIFDIRSLIEQGKPLSLPIFVAHSMSDTTTIYAGVENLMAYNKGVNKVFKIAKEQDVCHGNIVLNQQQVTEIGIDSSALTEILPCSLPEANPQHAEMLQSALQFLANN
ncbi:MAG: esterase/lipase [Paraglaciecola sp.]|jgi:esterase/lipase